MGREKIARRTKQSLKEAVAERKKRMFTHGTVENGSESREREEGRSFVSRHSSGDSRLGCALKFVFHIPNIQGKSSPDQVTLKAKTGNEG